MGLQHEQRKFGRRAVALHAVVEVQGRAHAGCVVRNLSDGGALIELTDKKEVPREFGLRLANSNSLIECQLVHTNGNNLGIKFKSQDGPRGAAAKRAIRNAQDGLQG